MTGQKSYIFSRKRERRLEGNLFTLTFALFKASRILAWEWINAPSRSVLGRLSANWDAIAIAEEFKDWKRAQVWKSEFHTKLHHFDVTGSPQGGRGEDLDKKFKQLVCKFWSNRGNMAPGNFLFPEAPLQPCVLDISWESINGGHWKIHLTLFNCSYQNMPIADALYGFSWRPEYTLDWDFTKEQIIKCIGWRIGTPY